MTYRVVPGEGLSTATADAPLVRYATHGEALPAVSMAFQSAYVEDVHEPQVTTITFRRVKQFHWLDFESGLTMGNDDDVEFRLIEILDSDLVRRLVTKGMHAAAPPGERLGASLAEDELHHYRIAFDDHGIYDVICVDIAVDRHESLESAWWNRE